jgi:hypothetical protein
MIAYWVLKQAYIIAWSFGIRCIKAGTVQYGHANILATSAGICDLLGGRSACTTYFFIFSHAPIFDAYVENDLLLGICTPRMGSNM